MLSSTIEMTSALIYLGFLCSVISFRIPDVCFLCLQLFNQFDAEGDGVLDRDTLHNVSVKVFKSGSFFLVF